MTATARPALEDLPLPPVVERFPRMLAHDAERVASVTFASGAIVFVRDVLEVGPDWLLVVSGHGESEQKLYVAIAAIATVGLR